MMGALEEKEDPEFEYSEGEDVQPEVHNKLLNAVSQIYKKQRIDKPVRREPTTQISEFNLSNKISENDEKLVEVNDLLNVLNKRATHHEIKKKVKSMQQKSKPLPKPMEKLHADKLRRELGFTNVRKQLNRWEAIVQRNRAAEQLNFPLQAFDKVKVKESHDFLKTFKEPTELEKEMAAVLQTSDIAQEEREKEEELFPLSLEEIIERRKMVAYMRARESYKMAKATRQNKIKSKKYHRILKRERIKKELKDFEILQKTNPEAALEKLEKIERARAEERITLRHRNTGKWARSRAIRAKYDTEARTQLAEQLAKSRELTRKVQSGLNSDSEDVEDDNENEQEILKTDPLNPWKPNADEQESEIASFVTGFKNYQNIKLHEKDEVKVPVKPQSSQNNGVQDISPDERSNSIISKQTNISDNDFIGGVRSSENGKNVNQPIDKINLVPENIIPGRKEVLESVEDEKIDSQEDTEIISDIDETVSHQKISPQKSSSCLDANIVAPKIISSRNNQTKCNSVSKQTESPETNYLKTKDHSDIKRNSPSAIKKSNVKMLESILANSTNLEKGGEQDIFSISDKQHPNVNVPRSSLNFEESNTSSIQERKSELKFSDGSAENENNDENIGRKSNISRPHTKKKQIAPKRKIGSVSPMNSEGNDILEISGSEKSIIRESSKLNKNVETEKKISITKTKKIKNKNRKNVLTQSGVWAVSSLVHDNNSIGDEEVGNDIIIDNIFDDAENVLKQTLNNRINQLKSDLDNDEIDEEPQKSKKRKYRPDLSMKSFSKRSHIDSTLIEVGNEGISSGNNDVKSLMDVYETGKKTDISKELPNIDPHKFLPVKPSKLNSGGLDLVEELVESADEEDEKYRQLNLEEAFADDDVVEEFRREKEADVESSKPKEIDLRLPGWGHWAGHDIDPNAENRLRRKNRRLIIKHPELPRKDNRKDFVIIKEELPPTLKNHLVHDLPFPFKSVKDYETSIRAPIGNTWVPRSAFMKLIKPGVVTKMGSIIEPMSESELLNFQERKFKKKKT